MSDESLPTANQTSKIKKNMLETSKAKPDAHSNDGQVTLTQMLSAIDTKDASRIESKLKKLSKKKAVKPSLSKNKADQLERKLAYDQTSKKVTQWDNIVTERRRAKTLKFPVNEPHDHLEPPTELLNSVKPTTKLEKEVYDVIQHTDGVIHDKQELSVAEQKYLKAISIEEAKDRHLQLQKMRALISCYGAKMRRQKAIKSKSYRRLLKHDNIRKHVKKVESDGDMLKAEVERLQRMRAQERASLKHKNTGKWAKHAKFRTKYDETARQAMIEQIGLAEKFLKKPIVESSNSEDDSDSELIESEVEEQNDIGEETTSVQVKDSTNDNTTEQNLIVSHELIENKSNNLLNEDCEDLIDKNDDSDEDEQLDLMREAFAGDNVVEEFQKEKERIADEEQPKDKDTFLPGWGTWTGPGTKVSRKKRAKYIIKAEKIKRRDENLGNVIISEKSGDTLKQYLVQKLPRGFKTKEQFDKLIKDPLSGTFCSQIKHRESIKPKVQVKLGAKIEPLNKRLLRSKKAKWVS